jgi:ERCC4-type nuclease
MDIIIDYREKDLIKEMKKTNTNDNLTISNANLELGDIQFNLNGTCILIFERKTVSDLAASISDGRYKEQSHRLTNASLANHKIYYLIEGNISAHKSKYSRITSAALLSSLCSLSYIKGFSIWNTASLNETTTFLLQWATKILKEKPKPEHIANNPTTHTPVYTEAIKISKKSQTTKENIVAIMLMQVPGVSSAIANTISDLYNNNIFELCTAIRENGACLNNIKYNPTYYPTLTSQSNRKINKKTIENIITLFNI